MSYRVLARKYRPQTFDEVVGQQHVVRTLRNAIATGRIAHAFLFVGPRGIGKTSTARILAKALNCTDGPNADFAADDPICEEIAEGTCMDVIEIDGASNRGVDEVRQLRENVQYAPTRGQFKVYIIDEVHMLTKEAFNALLKTLEEPPAHVKFIFATTEPHKVLATILSRCQRFDLRRISDQDIADHLGMISEKERISISKDALRIVARNAEGGLRDAESSLDQLISFCGNEIEESDVLEVFGLTGPREIWDLAEAIQNGESESAIQQVRDLVARGKDLSRLTQELLRYFRNLLVFSVSRPIAEAELDPTELHHFETLQPLPDRNLVQALVDELIAMEEQLRFALVKEVLFEIGVLRLAQQRRKVSIEAVIQRLVRGEENPLPIDTPIPTASASTSQSVETTQSESPADPSAIKEKKPEPESEQAPEAKEPETVQTLEPGPKPLKEEAKTEAQPEPQPEPESEAQLAAEPVPTPTATAPAPEKKAPKKESGGLGMAQLSDAWNMTARKLSKDSYLLQRAFDECHPDRFEDNTLIVKMHAPGPMYDKLMDDKLFPRIVKGMEWHLKVKVGVHIDFTERETEPEPQPESMPADDMPEPAPTEGEAVNEAAAARASRELPPIDQAEFENDPLIKAALEAFNARIVGTKR